MKFFDLLKNLFKKKELAQENQKSQAEPQVYGGQQEQKESQVMSVWDVLEANENTQAFHLISVIRFDEWVTMDEIRRRIMELFQIDYKNERSLYPYLKTMVDIGLMETNSVGGKRKWRKRDLLVKIEKKKEKNEEILVLSEAK